MKFLWIDILNNNFYKDFVVSNPESTIFHSQEWLTLLYKTYGFQIKGSAFYDGTDNKITGILPVAEVFTFTKKRKIVSLPFTDFCDPLFTKEFSLSSFFPELKEIAQKKGWKSFEIRGGTKYLKGAEPFTTIYTHNIDLTKEKDTIFNNFKPSLKRNIKNALRNGLKVSFSNSIEDLMIFYSHNCLTRKEHGLPPQPWIFFLNLYEYLLKKNMGFISIVKMKEKPLASAVFLIYNNKAYYKYGASIKKYQKLRINDLMMWESILKCKELGCSNLNLGRTEKHHTGLLQFKRGFNGIESEINYFLFSFLSNCFEKEQKNNYKEKFIHFAFSKMPIFMLKFVGKFFYRFAG